MKKSASTARAPRPAKGPPVPRIVPVLAVLPSNAALLDMAGPIDVLRSANELQGAVRFDVRCVGPTRDVMTSVGLRLHGVQPLPPVVPDGAILLVMASMGGPPLGPKLPGPWNPTEGDEVIVHWLRSVFRPGHKLVTVCTGALLAARAGLLDGYACTTYFDGCAELAAIAPRARVLENRIFVEDRDRYTSAGVTAGIDLVLHLVGQYTDPATVVKAARTMVMYQRRTGCDPQLSPWTDGRNHLHPAVHRVQDAITADPARAWSVDALARVAGTSSRHLARLFREQVGSSVTDYRNRLRVALARELLGQTQLDMERVAERAGFGSTRHLRRAWRALYDGAPSDLRRAARG